VVVSKQTETVDIYQGSAESQKIITISEENIDSDIDYGPKAIAGIESRYGDESNNQPWALVLLPAYMQSFNYLKLFKSLEEHNIRPSIIVGNEWSSVLAVLYANYKSVSQLEWRLFNLFQQPEQSPLVMQKKLIEIIDRELISVERKKIYPIVFTPAWNLRESRIVLELKENSVRDLKVNIYRNRDIDGHIAAWLKEIDIVTDLKKLGIKNIVMISASGERLKLDASDDYLSGIYAHFYKKRRNMLEKYKSSLHYMELNQENHSIDKMDDLMSMLAQPNDKLDEFVQKIKAKIGEKI
jgi:hypothetical protein